MKFEKDTNSLMRNYEKLYSQNEGRIERSLNRITNALHHREVDRVPVVQTTQTILYPRHEIFYSREKNLIFQLANINLTLLHKTDYVPYLDPFEGVTVLSEAFGCEVEVPENGDPWIRCPLIRDNPADVYLLKRPRIDNEVYKRIIETLKFFEEKTGYTIPVGATDPQGPLDVASLIWDNNAFLQACLLHKREVHHLLDIVTEAFIEFYSMQYDALKNPAYPVHSYPLVDSEDGVSISDDEAILLSPELYEEFGVPYLNRISEAFGGLYYHCCGDYGYLLKKILKINNLRAVNGHSSPQEFKPEYIEKIVNNRVGLFIGISDREIGWEDPDWTEEEVMDMYDRYYIPSVINNSKGEGVVLVGYGGYMGYMDIQGGGQDGDIMVGIGGHVIHRSPLVNVPVDKKNENYEHIISLINKQVNELGKAK